MIFHFSIPKFFTCKDKNLGKVACHLFIVATLTHFLQNTVGMVIQALHVKLSYNLFNTSKPLNIIFNFWKIQFFSQIIA